MSECPKYAPMLTARDGELSPMEQAGLEAHLGACHACRARLADERLISGLVGEALQAEASLRDFSGFSDVVLDRVEQRPWLTRSLARLWPFGQATPHRSRAWLAVPVLAAVALVVYLGLGSIFSERYEPGQVEVSSEGHDMTVIETDDGPVVLWGDLEKPEGT
jgi:anti-sigma factor RsiW